ncbi:hypothetical protein [Segatella oulorum]|uniref:hypothetical protein n=1 Tax=Segatella oulorum TaxID=28136 RepID=UPI0028E73AB1|nr:hypothetical protein [Segatella oulorum]
MLNLAEVPANIKKKICDLPAFRQTKKNKKSFAERSANVGKIKNVLPMIRQTPKKDVEPCRGFGKQEIEISSFSDASANPNETEAEPLVQG